MLLYSLLILVCLLLQIFIKKNRSKLFIGMLVILTIISAIRYNVGTDYQHYANVFSWIQEDLDVYVEIGYKYLNLFIQNILHFDVRGLFAITSIIIISLFGVAIKKNVDDKYIFLGLFIFICSGIYFSSFNLVRQYIGVAILAIGTTFLIKERYFYYILIIILASTFHSSAWIAIVFLALILICKKVRNPKLIWAIYILSLLFLIIDIRSILNLLEPIIPQRWTWYLNSEFLLNKNTSAVLKQVVPNIIMVLLLLKRDKIIDEKPENDIYMLGLLMCVIITNAFFGVMVLVRLADYFDIYLVFCIPLLIEAWKDKINPKLIYLAIIGYYIILTVVTIFIMGGDGVVPYQTIFS